MSLQMLLLAWKVMNYQSCKTWVNYGQNKKCFNQLQTTGPHIFTALLKIVKGWQAHLIPREDSAYLDGMSGNGYTVNTKLII